jgi:hypothetical protein
MEPLEPRPAGTAVDLSPEPPEPEGEAARRVPAGVAVLMVYGGVLVPVLCFMIGFPLGPDYQSGTVQDYAKLLGSHSPSMPWYPFLGYAITSLILLVRNAPRYSRHFLVRLGIYVGVVMAGQFWVLFGLAVHGDGAESFVTWPVVSVVGTAISVGACLLLFALLRRVGRRLVWPGMVIWLPLLGADFALAAVADVGPFSMVPVVLVIVGSLYLSTAFALAAYGAMAVYLLTWRRAAPLRFSLRQLLGVMALVAAWLGAWRISVRIMLDEYAKLPVEPPPDCYVATAAGRGHPRLVGVEARRPADGRAWPVNDQMRYLKAAELALLAASPRMHRLLRRIYDRVGPRLAGAVVHPLLADAAYLSLKPAEWLARAGLAILAPDAGESVRSLYWSGALSSTRRSSPGSGPSRSCPAGGSPGRPSALRPWGFSQGRPPGAPPGPPSRRCR